MNIHINHNGQQMGIFSREQVEGMIRSGVITYETLAWTEGQTVWKPLHEIIGASVPPPLLTASQTAVSKEIHPVAAYFVPVGRIGRGKWFLFNLMNLLGVGLLAAPFADSQREGASIWMTLLGCLWIYLTIVNAGKRLHDLNISAWLSFVVFIPLVPLFLLILSGTKGPNKYSSLPTQNKPPNTPGYPVTAASGGHSSVRPIVSVIIAVLLVVAGGVWLWLAQKAADQNNVVAQYNLGVSYDNGQGVAQDYVEAVKWYRKAAEQNYAPAQQNLGVRYYNGQGVAQDYMEAVKWFRKAAEQNYAPAQYDLGGCYADGKGVAKDEVEAVKWYRKAADQNFAQAQNNLGDCYSFGRGVVQDDVAALKWYQKAADQNCASAQANLGGFYGLGRGVAQDHVEAVKWFRKAAEQNDATAQCVLGLCYANGLGVPEDYVQAYKWYSLAAAHGDASALNYRDRIAGSMTPEQIAEGQRLSATAIP
jgi:TPR repeat protein/uncharacterized membrane protein YhaH (DUF805 family)